MFNSNTFEEFSSRKQTGINLKFFYCNDLFFNQQVNLNGGELIG